MSSLLNTKQKENNSRDLHTGLIEYKVVGINPTHEQLKEFLNTDKINPPNYVSNGKLRLDVWLRNEELDIKTKFSIWLEDKDRIARSSGNVLFINQKNQTTWAPDLETLANKPSMNWFDTSTARVCKIGEDKLYNFIVAFINADTNEGKIILDDFNRLITEGNTEELNKIVEHYNNIGRTIKLLTGVKDGRQEIYTEYFIRAEVRSTRALMNALEDRPFNNTFYQLDGIKKYNGESMDMVPSAETKAEVENSGGLF